ncbi:hypothetical protein [Rhodomicrobium lacus]|jgi:autotransporter adhesin|uniref:hypothetical protein n=1 Tax=Rhodomicrobium lacus TaxID=2498452 RepID=UPI0026E38535|nr:hypothetical protein [Rhodomicrobium lacus]WKW52285.1 hypothetical protein QMO75_07415 [Rhodomicrobium lacus]
MKEIERTLKRAARWGLASLAGATAAMSVVPAAHAETCRLYSSNTSTNTNGGAVDMGLNSMACGTNAQAWGSDSTAIGRDSSAFGFQATALGNGANAEDQNAVAVGHDAYAKLQNSTAIGQSSYAGANSTAIGQDADALYYSTALGQGANASGFYSTATGQNAKATAENATAIGTSSLASGANSTAVGQGARATHANSTAIGQGVATSRDNQVAVGSATNTYTFAGLTSNDSRAAQGTPTYLVTSNAAGDLATHSASDLGLATTGDITKLNAQIGGLQTRDNELAEGIAVSLALSQPVLQAGQTFATRVGFGNFDGSSAFGLTAAGVIDRGTFGSGTSVVLDGGFGVGSKEGVVAGKAGVTFGW